MKLALSQMSMSESIDENINKSIDALREAAANGANLILYPEIQLTPFFPQYERLDVSSYAMSIDHPFIKMLQAECAANHIMAAPNIYLLENGHTYDATILIDQNGQILGTQKMVHIAEAPCFFEQDYYTPSDDGFHVFETAYGNIGIVVCFDRHYPESIRTEALMGADLILIPTANTTAEPSDMFEWELRVQAFQSRVAVAMCNRVGLEGEMNFSGESIVVAADGSVIARGASAAASSNSGIENISSANAGGDIASSAEKILYAEQILYADIDLSKVRPYRDAGVYTSLRRPDLYL
ncbi:MAG: nitrilase-related carbon-nitrogen hydrolase [Eubacteriales bacterium]|nr:nitrilase-related carbon-nitrogen hydrolase [Eubacteriales bacterium]